jgi:1,4-alpha-glucan branching enzyme
MAMQLKYGVISFVWYDDELSCQSGSMHDPHAQFGLHKTTSGQVIRLWRPGAEWIDLEVLGRVVKANREDDAGLFTYVPEKEIGSFDYRIYHHSGLLAHDPYAFVPTIGEMDLFLFNKGCHYELYKILGANIGTFQGKKGVRVAVWAPNAQSVCLVGDFNHWDGRVNPMRSMGSSGIWELFVPGLGEGEKYKFEIRTREGYIRVKSDPVAFYSEVRPLTASVVADINLYQWNDQEWISKRSKQEMNRPIRIYEVHLGSWRRYDSYFPNYRQLARDLAQYAQEMHFTHVELLPVMEHPLDESWGYQVTGFFSATSRYGSVADFQFFVDYMHQMGIGVLLDWVPAHFPTDDFSLNRFDGTALYEHDDPRKGMHPHWNTAIFNYGRLEVSNFLIASALFWCEKMHVDGLRVDAVASLLYLDYGRKAGEWIPNPDGSNYNIEAIEFLKHLNAVVHERLPGVLMIAEESSSYQGVTHPASGNGLGFDLKWNMGWMNDTLRYFSKDPIYRRFHQNDLTFSMLYVFAEKFMSVLSHDEVVHGKNSLLAKMPGPDWQKFASVRLLYSYMICHPGKKLLFMGGELGQWGEWDSQGQIDWFLLQYPLHEGLHTMIRDLNGFADRHSALWKNDFSWEGFEWIDFSDAGRSIVSYLRKDGDSRLVVVHNFTPEVHHDYGICLAHVKTIREVFNTDEERFGGSNVKNESIAIEKDHFRISVAPLATLIFEVEFHV